MEKFHSRRSIRLKGYDYSQSGSYFVTICVQKKEYLFGNIRNGEMFLNDAGKMINRWYLELTNKFPNIIRGDYAIMPNHFHCIIIINSLDNNADAVRADLRVRPFLGSNAPSFGDMGEHVGSPLHTIIQWFKTMTTNEYIRGVNNFNWQPFDRKLWQCNYYEHIIRNEIAYQHISNYIRNNPQNWKSDCFW